ncbi:MAG: cell wall-active antibiotics response protein [Gemmatimonadota bacterium]|nr:cell wall-active antibiotics response protein [Gemmatimonadota bacterium]
MRRLHLAAMTLVLAAPSAAAQSMRPFSTYRQWHGETRIDARLDYAAGALRLAAGRPSELYRMDVLYDGDRYLPVSDYDAARSGVALGLRASGQRGLRVVSKGRLRQTAAVTFSPKSDLSLDVTLGAVDGDLELGGLRLTDLALEAGASRATVRFSRPNATRCRAAKLSAGAAELSVLGLGNSRCDRIAFEGGVGRVTLDFGGTWTSSSSVEVKMALGEVALRLPRQVGVRITLDKFLATFEPVGLVRRGGSYLSPGYDQAARHLDIHVTTAVGGVTVEWLAGER